MKKISLFDKAADTMMGEKIGDVDIEFNESSEEKSSEDDDSKEFEREEILKLVKDYQKKDASISKDLAKLALEDEERVWTKAQELALDNKPALKDFLKTLVKVDKSGEIQAIVNGLTTAPEAQPEKVAVEKKSLLETLDDVTVFKYVQSHPDFWAKLKKSEANMKVPTVRVFFVKNDPKKENMLLYKDIESNVILYFEGDVEKACSPEGWYISEYRIADSEDNPTDVVFDKSPKKGS